MSDVVRIPPCPFASIHWFRMAGTNPILDIHSHYVKQTFRNRFDLIGVNGKVCLTFPVEGQKGQKIPLREIKLVQGTWIRQHLGAISSGYGRAAFFEYYIDQLESIYSQQHTYLIDFSLATLKWYQAVGIELQFSLSESAMPFESDFIDRQLEPSYIAPSPPPYPQVFTDRHGFMSGLSVLDLIMHKGPEARNYLLAL
jgi:hypothetical protein